ncbi:hypothetical protein ACS0TY_026807 [Phlomoides rotata]
MLVFVYLFPKLKRDGGREAQFMDFPLPQMPESLDKIAPHSFILNTHFPANNLTADTLKRSISQKLV